MVVAAERYIDWASKKGDAMTDTYGRQHRAILQSIARRAMLEKGLVPDFPPQALTELDEIHGPDENLRFQDRVAQKLKALRRQHGALDLETIEAPPVFDGDALKALEVKAWPSVAGSECNWFARMWSASISTSRRTRRDRQGTEICISTMED
jgi:hypothetical protein